MPHPVRWAELLPDQFRQRQADCPVVYLPMGLCEPHGHAAAFGLDTLKADWLCDEAARRFGGIVAPTQGYQMHETGFHAPWLAEVLGDTNPLMTSMPPAIVLHHFLYQLRTFHNAGFRRALVLSGHSGGNQRDLRLAAEAFGRLSDLVVTVFSDPELVEGQYVGDHAGRYELSQLLYIRPDLVDLSRLERWREPDSLGRFAQGSDAAEATAAEGKAIMEAILSGLNEALGTPEQGPVNRPFLPFQAIDDTYRRLLGRRSEWVTTAPWPDQPPTPDQSRWKATESYDPTA